MALLKPPLMVGGDRRRSLIALAATLSEAGEAEIVKFALPAVTVSVTVVFCWIPPPLPVTVMGYVPVGVLAPTVMVIVELPVPGAGIGLRVETHRRPRGHSRGRQTDRAVEAAADGGGDGRRSLIALLDAERSRRSRNREIRRGRHRQRHRGVLLDASAVAGHRDGIGSRRRTAAHRDGHGRAARARRRNRVGIEAHRRARRHSRRRQS